MSADLQSGIQKAIYEALPPLPKAPRSIIVIGAGSIVRDAHLPAYRKAGFPVAALVDANLEKATGLAEEFSILLATTSLAEAISKSPQDSVFDVAVPAGAVLDVLPLLPDGAAALIQKPMGRTLEEAEQILAICSKKGTDGSGEFSTAIFPCDASGEANHGCGTNRNTARHGSGRMCRHAVGFVDLFSGGATVGDSLPQHSLCRSCTFVVWQS
jgi:hypothetical protein